MQRMCARMGLMSYSLLANTLSLILSVNSLQEGVSKTVYFICFLHLLFLSLSKTVYFLPLVIHFFSNHSSFSRRKNRKGLW